MPVSTEHLNNLCQVWDGITVTTMDIKEAKKLEKEGRVQITKNLQAKDLKRRDEFVIDDKQDKPKKKRGRPRKTYETREMKAKD